MTVTMKSLVPMLHIKDIARTIQWYESVLGFRCTGKWQDVWCRLERDGAALMFGSNDHFGKPSATAVQYIYVDHVTALFEQLDGAVEPEWGPDLMPYGNLEFAIRDPDGYLLSFGQVMAD